MSKKAVTTEYTLTVPKLAAPLRLALISDIHERRQDDVLRLLQDAAPDLIAVAGDTFERYAKEDTLPEQKDRIPLWKRMFFRAAFCVNDIYLHTFGRKNMRATENANAFLREAAKMAPVFLSLGNHEQQNLEDEDVAFLRENGIVLVNNSDATVMIGENTLYIGGVPDDADEDWLRRFAQKDGFKLLLCHRPEYYDDMVRGLDIDLTLAGHNHGGQIRLFGRGVLSSHAGLFPKYDKGVFEDRLVVSAGCSNTVALPRWHNPRELVLIHLVPEK